ncbi:aminoglycoside phosphotransferase (APT) family kinase protein [Streptosporangium becharense]|uniref:Aminoglycoside phosphotransferase (APT) family kinase protein n=1 Tax=Streptosporangium becharense TaxID=1816182 RepID=A0A7W9MJN7_9ACTN|nr:phosphotransferase [Streptosporangium becharense]MBB2910138.1 aminoglycoside phosphotransferase (APT) family kinase protein [Streptosporangium becharense]MBB5822881.1 aminoglycoside phosphotransferase (APT) family kinase protein [Streptosporangium becharense]
MDSRTKRALEPGELDALTRRALGTGVAASTELTDGFANAVWRLRLLDGREVVLKLSPPPELEQLRYERDLLRTEAMVYGLAGPAGVPVPELLWAGFDDPVLGGDYLVLSALDGVPWNQARVDEADGHALRRELGGHLARLNAVTGDVYGYPHAGLTGATWRAAFLTMVGAVLADADRYALTLPRPPAEISAVVEASAGVLDEVTVPRLVHFDAWPGNVFLTRGASPRVQAIIDHERAFWGDPLADFVTPTIFGELNEDDEIVAGYREAGGIVEFTPSARARIALYRLYLSLIMLVEHGPRQYPQEHYAFIRDLCAADLAKALDLLSAAS